MGQCATYLQSIAKDAEEVGQNGEASKKSNKGKKLLADPTFKAVLKEVEAQRNRPGGFSLHPKMERLKAMVVQHFGEKMGEPAEQDTKVMVFATFRETVDEIVEVLKAEQPLIRPTRFVGQGSDKQGKKGIAQKEQLEVREPSSYISRNRLTAFTRLSRSSRPESITFWFQLRSERRD
jgi:ATP-dependent DNA helicase MPH1